MLSRCKEWSGPLLTVDEMKSVLHKLDEDSRRKVLRYELTYQKATHPNDALTRIEFYLIKKQSASTITYNLSVLLGDDRVNEVFLSTKADAISVISTTTDNDIVMNSSSGKNLGSEFAVSLRLHELCSVVWEYKGKTKGYLGFVLDIKDEYIKIEHLGSNL